MPDLVLLDSILEPDKILWRQDFEENVIVMKRMLKNTGQTDPIALTRTTLKYKIIDGNARVTAARALGWSRIQAEIYSVKHKQVRLCDYCGLEVDMCYMLEDEIWLKVMPSKSGQLHLGCFEAKLGRRLITRDLKQVPVNELALHMLSNYGN